MKTTNKLIIPEMENINDIKVEESVETKEIKKPVETKKMNDEKIDKNDTSEKVINYLESSLDLLNDIRKGCSKYQILNKPLSSQSSFGYIHYPLKVLINDAIEYYSKILSKYSKYKSKGKPFVNGQNFATMGTIELHSDKLDFIEDSIKKIDDKLKELKGYEIFNHKIKVNLYDNLYYIRTTLSEWKYYGFKKAIKGKHFSYLTAKLRNL